MRVALAFGLLTSGTVWWMARFRLPSDWAWRTTMIIYNKSETR